MSKKSVVVLGGGPAGYSVAIYLAHMGAQVTLVEKQYLGGTCLNVGCIPTKAFVEAAAVYASIQHAAAYGITVDGATTVNGKKLVKFKNKIVKQLVSGVGYLLEGAGVTVVRGTGKLTSPHTVLVELPDGTQQNMCADAIVLATGSHEVTLPGFEADGEYILNSTQMLDTEVLPENITIIGGGVIGVEFASIFARFGKAVNIVELTRGLIPTEDEDIADDLKVYLEDLGVCVYTNTQARNVLSKDENGVTLLVETPDGEKELTTEKLLVCIGRHANLSGIGLEDAGVEYTPKCIPTDVYMRTNIPSIYAIGDLTASPMLAHAGYFEARIAAQNIMGAGDEKVDYRAIPSCIFSYPEVARVGMTEREAKLQYPALRIEKEYFSANGKAMIHQENSGYVKLLIDGEHGRLVGCSIIGPKATELIAEPTLAVTLGLDIHAFAQAINAHPSLSEVIGEAACGAIGLKLHSM